MFIASNLGTFIRGINYTFISSFLYTISRFKSQSLIIMYNNNYYYCTCSIVLGLNRESKKFCFCTNSSIDVEPLRGTLGIES